MNKRNIKVTSVILSGLLLLNSSALASQEQIDQKKLEQENIQAQMQSTQAEINALEAEIQQINVEIRQLDNQIISTQNEINLIQGQINELKAEIEKNRQALEEAKAKLSEYENGLSNRIREQYMNGNISPLEVLIGSEDITDFLTRMDVIDSVVEKDQELMDLTDKQIEFIEKTEKVLQDQEEELLAKRQVELNKIQELEGQTAQKNSMLSQLGSNKAYAQSEYENYSVQESSLSEEIRRLEEELEEQRRAEEERRRIEAEKAAQAEREAQAQREAEEAAKKQAQAQEEASQVETSSPSESTSTSTNKTNTSSSTGSTNTSTSRRTTSNVNRSTTTSTTASPVTYSNTSGLAWPTPGYHRITSPYGYRIHPIFKVRKFHAGIDIGLPYGKPIVAADSGIVISSGWKGGYGNTVIVSHGNGISTLYAHNSSNQVSVGDYVEKGQTIALCGSTGNSTGPHLHFEVRKNGSTTNPMDWY